MLVLVRRLAQEFHLPPVEINGGSGQLWLCVEQMAEEWPFLLLWDPQPHTNRSALISGIGLLVESDAAPREMR